MLFVAYFNIYFTNENWGRPSYFEKLMKHKVNWWYWITIKIKIRHTLIINVSCIVQMLAMLIILVSNKQEVQWSKHYEKDFSLFPNFVSWSHSMLLSKWWSNWLQSDQNLVTTKRYKNNHINSGFSSTFFDFGNWKVLIICLVGPWVISKMDCLLEHLWKIKKEEHCTNVQTWI